MKRWWTKELTDLKKEKNRLSKMAHHFRGTPDHPYHTEHKEAAWKLSNCIDATKKKHWSDWLEKATFNNIYTANKYINSDPTDYSNTCIPDLKTFIVITQTETLATNNETKAKSLTKTFFPLPPTTPVIQAITYPKPLKAKGTFSKDIGHQKT